MGAAAGRARARGEQRLDRIVALLETLAVRLTPGVVTSPPPIAAAAPATPVASPPVRALANWRTWYLGGVWVLQCSAYYGIVFWMPLLIGQMMPDAPATHVALFTAVPYTCASAAMLANAWVKVGPSFLPSG